MVTPTFCISLNFFPKSLGIMDTEGKKNNNDNNTRFIVSWCYGFRGAGGQVDSISQKQKRKDEF